MSLFYNRLQTAFSRFHLHVRSQESYDHVVRDQNELYRIVNYILNNPVKAKLCSDPSNWECSYFNPDYFV